MFKCDYHIHSLYSNDSTPEMSVDGICKTAIEKGVTDIAITDHFECNWLSEEELLQYDADAAENAVMSAKEKYKGRINLTYGIEIGQANQYPEAARKLLCSHNYEFVIGSVHRFMNMPDFKYLDFKALCKESRIGEFFERYIDDITEAVDVLPKLDTVAHLTYTRRYCELCGVKYDFTKHFAKVEKFYQKIIAKSIALEINLSTLLNGLGFPMPDRDFLSLYREMGGRLVTVGTDSHLLKNVGEQIDTAFELLRKTGLREVLVVRGGKKETVLI